MTISASSIQNLYSEAEINRWIFDHFSTRTNNQRETKLDRIEHLLTEEGYEFNHGQVIHFFKRLEELDCGKYIIGRRGGRSRFAWSVNMLDVTRIAVGESESIEETDVEEDYVEDQDYIDHHFNLRPDERVEISLPADLTNEESKRLSQFILALPFD
jgi:hypothetical protein